MTGRAGRDVVRGVVFVLSLLSVGLRAGCQQAGTATLERTNKHTLRCYDESFHMFCSIRCLFDD